MILISRKAYNNLMFFCPQPPPIVQQFCNVIDCKPGWKKGSWSKVNNMIVFVEFV